MSRDRTPREGLTLPQRSLLSELPTICFDNYPPARKLVEMGLAVWAEGRYGNSRLLLTDKGREALRHAD